MLPSTIDFRHRAELSEWMDEPCSPEILRSCLQDLARVNRWFLAYRPVSRWLDSLELARMKPPIHIVDVGCGYGDGLRRVEEWARKNKIQVKLTGLDLNPLTVEIAKEATSASSSIQWVSSDVFAFESTNPIHVVVSSLFTHHLADSQIVKFLRWMEDNARLGWFINDLSRNAVPYCLFRLFSKMTALHPFVQHDGPVSIARAFVPADWKRLCAETGLGDGEISIEGFTPARLCVGRRKQQ
jgi:2-polyprenyl-3-methyl-5-hydroxy-6-metoxy-1,4-benzoquinol methylase